MGLKPGPKTLLTLFDSGELDDKALQLVDDAARSFHATYVAKYGSGVLMHSAPAYAWPMQKLLEAREALMRVVE